MARKSTKSVRQSKLTQWQRKKEERKKQSEDYKNGQRFFSAIKGEQANGQSE